MQKYQIDILSIKMFNYAFLIDKNHQKDGVVF